MHKYLSLVPDTVIEPAPTFLDDPKAPKRRFEHFITADTRSELERLDSYLTTVKRGRRAFLVVLEGGNQIPDIVA